MFNFRYNYKLKEGLKHSYNDISIHHNGMRLERDSFKTEWGASPRAQGTVMLLREISQTRAVMNSQHTPEADVRAREGLQGGGYTGPLGFAPVCRSTAL